MRARTGVKNYTRRAVVGLAAATAACAALGGTVKAFAGEMPLLRPPGAQDEAMLWAACIKCDRCRSICPTGVIGVASAGDGFVNARTPVLDFHRGLCDFCGLCERVCPTGAIGPFDESTEKVGMAVVQKDRCIAYFDGCRECADACPYEAISLDEAAHPIVDPQLCNGCGVCENICPALVYRSFSGGTRRGIQVVTMDAYDKIGATVVDGEGA